jgi:hypothetical protein
MNHAGNIFSDPGARRPVVWTPLTSAQTRDNQVPARVIVPPQRRSDHRFSKISLHTSRGHGKIRLKTACSSCFQHRSHKYKCQ